MGRKKKKKCVVNGGASFLCDTSELFLLASFFASMAQCICLDPSMGVSGMCGGEMNLCSLADYYCPFVCLSSCYFLLSQVFTPTHNTTNTGGNKKECTILIFFIIFTLTCYLEHSVRNHLRLF